MLDFWQESSVVKHVDPIEVLCGLFLFTKHQRTSACANEENSRASQTKRVIEFTLVKNIFTSITLHIIKCITFIKFDENFLLALLGGLKQGLA